MARKRKPKMEFRYYNIPAGIPMLALLGEKWKQIYGDDVNYLHFHNYMEIGYCHSGQGTLVFGEEEIRFEGGEFTVIPVNFPHTTNSDPDTVSYWEYIYIDVDKIVHEIYSNNSIRADRILQRLNAGAIMKRSGEASQIAFRIREILEVMRKKEEFYLEEGKGLLMALVMGIVRMCQSENQNNVWEEDKKSHVITEIVDYIGKHYMEQLRVEKLAEKYHFSVTHFRREFAAYMKMSPLEYINLVRIHAACDYLKSTDRSVTEISQLCGFVTLSTFNRNFNRIIGMSPCQWRKRPENYEQQLLKYTIHSEEGW